MYRKITSLLTNAAIMKSQFRVLAKVDAPNDPAYYFISGRMLGLNE
jgi:hypothetical protein